MATAHTAIKCQHATFSTTTVDTVTLSGQGTTLAVTNRDSTNTMYFTMQATATGGATTVVAAADETYVVLPLQTKTVAVRGTPPPLSLIGSGGGYSVELY